jgi:hypothetical protein
MDLGARDRPVEIISVDIPAEERVGPRLESLVVLKQSLVVLKRAAQHELPQLLSQLRSRPQGRGTRFAVLCDLETGRLLCLRLDDDGDPSRPIWRIRIEVDPATGRLSKPVVRQTG